MWLERYRKLGLWSGMLVHRAGRNIGVSCAFAFLGALNSGLLIEIPLWLLQQEKNDVWRWYWSLSFLLCFISALIILLVLRVSVARAAHLVRNRWRFVAVFSSAALLVSMLAWPLRQALQSGVLNAPSLPTLEYLDFWLQEMLWDGLIAWLYLHYLQKMEDRATFACLLARRAGLARQLAQAELMALRAQIDPALLTSVLQIVHSRYVAEPENAAALLDQLIAYLRLVMNRKRVKVLTPAMQLAIDQALHALHAAVPPRES